MGTKGPHDSNYVSSTRPQEERRSCVSIHAPGNMAPPTAASFNPRAGVGRDVITVNKCTRSSPFLSTRPCGARLAQGVPGVHGGPVSIHAPARGATYFLYKIVDVCIVSIQAPAGGRYILRFALPPNAG